MSRYVPGQWNAICDRCGFKFKSGELKRDWQGLMVCDKDYELRNQQDFIKVKPEKAIPEWVRPRPEDVFLQPLQCTLEGMQGVAGQGVAGCSKAAFVTPF